MPDMPRYTTGPVRLATADVDRTAARWRADFRREIGSPAVNAAGLMGGMTAIGAVIGGLPMLGGKSYAMQAPLALGGVGALLVVRRVRTGMAELEARIAALRTAPDATEHRLSLAGPHRFLPHDHGILVIVPLNDAQCVVLDLSSVSDDPLHAPVQQALATGTVPATWRWVESADGQVTEFVMEGPPVAAVTGDEGWDGAVVERVMEAKGDGYIVGVPFSAFG